MALKRMSIRISEELHRFLAEESEREGLSMNAVIIFALNSYKQQQTAMSKVDELKRLVNDINAK